MAEPHLKPAAVDVAGDQPSAFEGLDDGGIGQLGQGRLVERLAQGEELQHFPLGVGQVTQPQRHELGQAVRGLQGAPQAPDADHLLDERAGLDGSGHQLAQEQRVALAVLGQLAHRRRLDRSTEHGDQQLLDRRVVQDGHLDAFGRTVLPQRHHRVGRCLPRPHGGHHGGRPGQRQLVDQRAGPGV